jgi:cell division septal protein FtsQ
MRAGFRSLPSWKKPRVKRRRRRIAFVVLALTGLAAAAPFLAGPTARALGALPPFRVGGIEISGLLYLSPEEIRAGIPIHEGDNLLLISASDVEAALRKNTRVESVRVDRYPGKVAVRVRERRTFALVNAGSLLEVDEGGTILTPLQRGLIPDRPVISGLRLPTVKPGARITTSRLADLLRLVALLETPEVGLLSEISEIVAEGPNRAVLRTSRDQIPIYVDPERVTKSAMRAVAATLRDVREHDRRVVAVDARYRGQVVVKCAPEGAVSGPGATDARGKA